jgi:glycosyltransferase involved in cell wall biosynthesis
VAPTREPALDLAFWLPAINPYWARRLTALHASGRVRFTCWFNTRRGAGRDWVVPSAQMRFPHEFLPTTPVRRYLRLVEAYRSQRPERILTFHFEPSLWPSVLHRLRPGELAFYVEKSWDSYVHRTRSKEYLKRFFFNAASTVFVTGEDADEYVRGYRQSDRPTRLLPHVVDLELLSTARRLRKPSRHVRLLYLGRLVQGKGLDDFFQALKVLKHEHLDVSAKVVGSGPLEEAVHRWSEELGNVTCQGFVQAADLVPILAEADLLVFPTHADTYGLVINEAMAAGLPVISSDAVGEVRTRLIDGELPPRGDIYPAGDVGALADVIRSFAVEPERLSTMSRAACEFADSAFGLEHWVASIEQWCFGEH